MTEYCLGFCFNTARSGVVLIEKQKPEWQAGLLNGVGGKMEGDENSLRAMIREFIEETGVTLFSWEVFCRMTLPHARVWCYRAFDDGAYFHVQSATEEPVVKVPVCRIHALGRGVVSNLRWLIPLALDIGSHSGGPKMTEVAYGHPD